MVKKTKKVVESHKEIKAPNSLVMKFKWIKSPGQAIEQLQESIEINRNLDKHELEHFILNLRQIAQDIQFKYYKARCKAIIIPPEDSLTFCVDYFIGSINEKARFSTFESKVQELLKILSQITQEIGKGCAPLDRGKAIETPLALFEEKYPVFFKGVTKDPILIPLLNFSVATGSVLSLPDLHCFGLFKSKSKDEPVLVSVLHSLAHILHYQLTGDLTILPPGFANLHHALFDDELLNLNWSETFADLLVASLLYETEYMPLVAYMELSQEDQMEIKKYLSWLEMIYASYLQDNIQRLILKSEGKLRA